MDRTRRAVIAYLTTSRERATREGFLGLGVGTVEALDTLIDLYPQALAKLAPKRPSLWSRLFPS